VNDPIQQAAITDVTGGAGSVRVEYAELERIAVYSEETAVTLGAAAAQGHLVLVDPDLLASAVLDPGGVAKVESLLLRALDGSGGLVALAATVGARGAEIRLASLRYQATDAMEAAAMRTLDAFLAAAALPAALQVAVSGAGLLVGGTAALALAGPAGLLLAGTLGESLAEAITQGGPGAAAWLLTEHPGVLDHVVRGLPAVVVGPLVGCGIDPLTSSRLLADAYPDSPGHLTPTGPDPEWGHPPHTLADLMERLDHRNEEKGPDKGQLDVQVLRAPDGSIRSVIVDVTGTDTWDFAPGQTNDSGSINDLPTNLHSLTGETTSYETMVGQALAASGVPTGPDGPPVMLVGHSQGGIVAATAAGYLPYNVTHVVTAGSPVGNIPVPPGVQMLSLENNSDLVPHLDARANADAANHTTVTFDLPGQAHDIGTAHSIGESYLPAAQRLDQGGVASVDAFTASASAFLGTPSGTTIITDRYYASRGQPRGGSE
jgi:hypothetical protein